MISNLPVNMQRLVFEKLPKKLAHYAKNPEPDESTLRRQGEIVVTQSILEMKKGYVWNPQVELIQKIKRLRNDPLSNDDKIDIVTRYFKRKYQHLRGAVPKRLESQGNAAYARIRDLGRRQGLYDATVSSLVRITKYELDNVFRTLKSTIKKYI